MNKLLSIVIVFVSLARGVNAEEPRGVRLRWINESGQHTTSTAFIAWGESRRKIEEITGPLACSPCKSKVCMQECDIPEEWTVDFGRNVVTLTSIVRFCGDGLGAEEFCEYQAPIDEDRKLSTIVEALEAHLGEPSYKESKYDEFGENDHYRWYGERITTSIVPTVKNGYIYLRLFVANKEMQKSLKDKPTAPF